MRSGACGDGEGGSVFKLGVSPKAVFSKTEVPISTLFLEVTMPPFRWHCCTAPRGLTFDGPSPAALRQFPASASLRSLLALLTASPCVGWHRGRLSSPASPVGPGGPPLALCGHPVPGSFSPMG